VGRRHRSPVSFGDVTCMRRRTIALGIGCAVLNGIASWSAFHGPDWLTNGATTFIVLAVIGLLVNLLMHSGDWRFRGPALGIVSAYLSLMAFEIWRYYKYAQ
jgi:hypothetical protein